jgi:flagellar basal-body rod modification protein FlgD
MAGVVAPTTSSSSSASSSSTGTSSSSDSGTTDAINNLDLGSFLTLMIKELQNQDPLNPMDNSQMLTQLSEIRQVGSTDKLTSTLNSVLLGQNISSATNLIGANITALSDDNQQVSGVVDKVSIADGTPKLHVASYPSLGTVAGSGDITAGSYKYQVVWQDSTGAPIGLDFSDHPISTTGSPNQDSAIQINNLPQTSGPKYVYRSDASGNGPYRLIGEVTDGGQSSFVDKLSDSERGEAQLAQNFQPATITSRSYDVTLSNVSGIEPQGNVSTPSSTSSSP